MTYEECIQSLHDGCVITFKEYVYDRHQRKKLSLSISDGVVKEVWQPAVTLPRDTLIQYYGEELDDIVYMQLANSNDLRIVISLGLNHNNEEDVKIVSVNKDFYNTELQEIELISELDPSNMLEPNYLLSQGGWN